MGLRHAAVAHAARLELRDGLVERWLPEGFDHVFFTSGGSESTDSTIRLARAYQVAKGRPDRWKVIGRHPSYHGMTLGTMAVASHSARQTGYEPLLLPFPKVPWDDPEQVVKVIEQEDPATIAGFIVEPITGAAGACLTASDEYWRVVTEVCREHDILLIADEVMTGYGRTGATWGHQHFPFVPDVIVGGKGLGGGYVPMGAVAATDEVVETLPRRRVHVLHVHRQRRRVCRGRHRGARDPATRAPRRTLRRHGCGARAIACATSWASTPVVDIRGRGLFYGLELTCSRDAVVKAALERDMWVYPAGLGPGARRRDGGATVRHHRGRDRPARHPPRSAQPSTRCTPTDTETVHRRSTHRHVPSSCLDTVRE